MLLKAILSYLSDATVHKMSFQHFLSSCPVLPTFVQFGTESSILLMDFDDSSWICIHSEIHLTGEILFVDAEEAVQQDHAPLVIFVLYWLLIE